MMTTGFITTTPSWLIGQKPLTQFVYIKNNSLFIYHVPKYVLLEPLKNPNVTHIVFKPMYNHPFVIIVNKQIETLRHLITTVNACLLKLNKTCGTYKLATLTYIEESRKSIIHVDLQ